MISSPREPKSGTGSRQPVSGSVNSKDRFFTRSGYRPPSAAKLMSSKKTPNIVGEIGGPGRLMSMVTMAWFWSGACPVAAIAAVAITASTPRPARARRRCFDVVALRSELTSTPRRPRLQAPDRVWDAATLLEKLRGTVVYSTHAASLPRHDLLGVYEKHECSGRRVGGRSSLVEPGPSPTARCPMASKHTRTQFTRREFGGLVSTAAAVLLF